MIYDAIGRPLMILLDTVTINSKYYCRYCRITVIFNFYIVFNLKSFWLLIQYIWRRSGEQRKRDICGRTTSIWQFSSEMQQTWHIYYSRPQEQLLLQRFFYKFRSWTVHFRWISPIFSIFHKVSKVPQP
jgi:hypothetical protein